jgi:hypothetical protein
VVLSTVTPLTFVRATMIAATGLWAVGEVLMRRSAPADRLARLAWTMGAGLALVHVILAFEVAYAWDHEAAVRDTVRQAEDLFGWGPRSGIYVNYVFIAAWLADIVWWWIGPVSRAQRPRSIELARFAFFSFMFLNGAVLFAAGAGRFIGIVALAAALLSTASSRLSPARKPSFWPGRHEATKSRNGTWPRKTKTRER